MVTVGHVTAAVSCLEMALWSTLWMADKVTLMAGGRLPASRMGQLMNFLACGPGRPVVSRMKGTRLMCGILSNVFFYALLAISPGFVLAAETRDGLHEKESTNGHIQIRDRTVEVKDKIHPSMFSLSVDNTGESRYLLFNKYLSATV